MSGAGHQVAPGPAASGLAEAELVAFAEEVGPEGPVCVAGGMTQWAVGGLPEPGTRQVRAPSGVVAHEPAEMVVRVQAGTTLAELQEAVAKGGQRVCLEAEDPSRATVGGLLAVGRSGYGRLGQGPIRDAVLEARYVSAEGRFVRSGAPLVKNVTGYDLCRLLVGSLGTLGLLAQVVLRCVPKPIDERWYCGEGADPFATFASLYRPLAVLWDGTRTWVGLSGHPADVEEQASAVLGRRFSQVEGPPPPPGPHRRSLAPVALRGLAVDGPGRLLAEVGVGLVHADAEAAASLPEPPQPDPVVVELHRRLKERFDPAKRLNPGRSVL